MSCQSVHSCTEEEIIDAALEAFYAPSGQRPWHPVAIEAMRSALTAVADLLETQEYPLVRFCRCRECRSNPNPSKMTPHDVVIEGNSLDRNVARFRTHNRTSRPA